MTTTGLVGIAVAVLNIWWVQRYRTLGAYNVDEAGYIAAGLRLERLFLAPSPIEFLTTAGAPAPTGPLVPVLSVPVIAVFGRSATAAVFTQCLISVVVAMVAAGIVGFLADRRAARVTGLVMLVVPALLQSARGFQYASAAAACLGAAIWALLRSDRGHRRWAMVAFGAALGAMVLARTMAIAFLPGAAVAAAVFLRRDRRAVTNLAVAVGATLVVAGPWWFVSRGELYDWLFRLGYGTESAGWGSAGLGDRVRFRVENLVADFRIFAVAGLVIAVVGLGVVVARRLSSGTTDDSTDDTDGRTRAWAAVSAAIVVSYAVLLTTRHQGTWFELPLEVLLVSCALAALAVIARRPRLVLEAGLAVVGVLTLVSSVVDHGGELAPNLAHPDAVDRMQDRYYSGLIEKERVLALADPTFFSNDRADRARASREWWAANVRIAEVLDEERDAAGGDLMVTMSGSSHLVNTQSVTLAHEIGGTPTPPIEIPATGASERRLQRFLEPETADGLTRVIVLIRATTEAFPDDREVPRFRRMALAAGWREERITRLPDSGDVVILRQPQRDSPKR